MLEAAVRIFMSMGATPVVVRDVGVMPWSSSIPSSCVMCDTISIVTC